MNSRRMSSTHLSTSKTIAPNRAKSPTECAPADNYAEKNSLPADIWLLITQNHLLDSPATVAALSSTNRQFNVLLRPFKFREVSVRLELSSAGTTQANTSTSPALGFAQLVQSEPDIIDHIRVLRIGHEEDVELRAINGALSDDSERRSLCYILTCRYTNLKHLAFTFRHTIINPYTRRIVPTLPDPVLHSILSALSLPSLSEISIFMGCIPWEVYSRLHETRIDTLNIGFRMINQEGFPPESQTNWHSRTLQKLRTLRIDTFGEYAISTLLPKLLDVVVSSNSTRLTTLVLKFTAFQAAFNLPSSSFPTVMTLKLYFFNQRDGKFFALVLIEDDAEFDTDGPGSNLLDVKAFSALRTLTLGFNLAVKRPSAIRAGSERLEWTLGVLQRIKPDQPLECVNFFIDDLVPYRRWIDRLSCLPWSDLQKSFSPGSFQFHWQTLQQINIGFALRDPKAFNEQSNWALLDKNLRPKLALHLDSGVLRLHLPIFSKSLFFDNF